MEQENITTYECLKEEVAGMRGDLSRVLDYIVAKEEKERKAREKIDARPQLPLRPMVTKEEAAAILLVFQSTMKINSPPENKFSID